MFKIYAKFQGGIQSEIIEEVDTEEEARELKVEYMIAFGPSWEITIG